MQFRDCLERFSTDTEQAKKKYLFVESVLFAVCIGAWELFMIIIYAIWLQYKADLSDQQEDVVLYPYCRDVAIMIFFGFGFLMTFLRRAGYSAIGYSILIAALVTQWSIILQIFFEELDISPPPFDARRGVGVAEMLNGLFCGAAVLITYGAILGKVTPLQVVVLSFIEPFFYWLNIFVCSFKLEALDIGGGMFIHTFGAYYGLALSFFFTFQATKAHPDNCSSYGSDIFSMAGTIFLLVMWPSFNGAVAATPLAQDRAFFNTFISLCAATATTFFMSRLLSKQRLDMVHIQNSILAGGVVMGVAADQDLHPAVPIGTGFVVAIVSVFGYKYLTPFLSHHFNLQDICGIHNLHGMPGVLSGIVGIFATLGRSQENADDFPRGTDQPGIQTAALFITLGIAILSGVGTGLLLFLVHQIHRILRKDYFNDRYYWHLPSDYEYVVDKVVDGDMEMTEMRATHTGSHIRGLKAQQVNNKPKDNEKTNGQDSDSDETRDEPRVTRTGTVLLERKKKSPKKNNEEKQKKQDSDQEIETSESD